MPTRVPESLKTGVNVDIQRSDGRVHSAVISGVNEESQSVTVEWFEHSETKGKELDIESVLRLNPNLIIKEERRVEPTPRVKKLHAARTRRTLAINQKRPKSTIGVDETPKPVSRLPSNRKSYVPSSAQSRRETISSAASEESVPNTVTKPKNSRQSLAPAGKKPPVQKSAVVMEIDKIKEGREKRRQAAAEAQAKVIDKSHPNWKLIDMIEEYRETLDFDPLRGHEPIEEHQITVCVRKRPLNKKEVSRRDVDVVTIPNKQNVLIHEPKQKVDLTKYLENQNFRFDYAFDEEATNLLVYRYTAQPLVQCAFDGGKATCFAYGQTGSGKTHTMGGEFVQKGQQKTDSGIYAYSARDVFTLQHSKYRHLDLIVSVSFFEIYSGKVFDLLNNKLKLRILEDGKNQVQVVGLKEEVVTNAEQVLRLLQQGTQCRTSGQTSANQHSSRSHAILQLILRKNVRNRPLHGKFSLIDLAGNERGADTSSADRQTRIEGAEINKSLLALKECIRALGRKATHQPFRASKLTLVLRDSFIGDNAKTCMISTISPGNLCCEHTLNTLRYADRVKGLGADGPAPGENGGKVFDESAFQENVMMSPQNSDLAMLRTQNQEEVSDDLLHFHEVVNHMQELEEEIIDDYKTASQLWDKWKHEDTRLLKQTEKVDYDVETFAKHLDGLLEKRIQFLNSLRDKVTSFREDLVNEESISKKFMTP